MNRYIDFDKETDGKRYSGKDMARLGCNDCNGCHKCCTGMGKSIVLDPYDIYMLKKCLKRNFDELINSVIGSFYRYVLVQVCLVFRIVYLVVFQ